MGNTSPVASKNTGIFERNSIEAKIKPKDAGKRTKNGLSKDSFLKLLITELKHQDPTKPMNDKEFISQMAQFSALEQMTEINKSIKSLTISSRSGEAFSLLGKGVEALNPINGKGVKGVVSRIFYRNDGVRLIVNNIEIGLSDIHAIYNVESANNNNNKKTFGIKENSANMNTTKDIEILNDTNIRRQK